MSAKLYLIGQFEIRHLYVCVCTITSVSDPEGFMNNVKFPQKT